MTKLLNHPAAERFPMMNAERLNELARSIRENGLRDPIVLLNGAILDGRNRYAACAIAEVTPRYVDFDKLTDEDDNPYRYVWDKNGHRRDIDAAQREAIGILLEKDADAFDKITMGRERRKKISDAALAQPRENNRFASGSGSPDPHPEPKTAKSDRHLESPTRRRMHAVEKHSPELLEKVARGEVKGMQALRDVQRAALSSRIEALPPDKFRVIYADPPWKYGDERTGLEKADTAAAAQYPTMSVEKICALDIRSLAARDSVLFMWATFPLLDDGLSVMKAWGFDYKTAFVWDKERSNIGNYHDARAELLMIGVRGSCPIEIKTRPKQIVSIARGKHSAKPEEFRALIDKLYPSGPAIELFRRGEPIKTKVREWKVWGNEAKQEQAA